MADRYGKQVAVLHPDPSLQRMAEFIWLHLADCPTCGDRRSVVGLTVKCRDWHEVCQCGARYDQPRGDGCRRRAYSVGKLSIPAHPLPARPGES